MRRDLVLLDEIVQAAERIIELTSGLTVDAIEEDDLRREAVLWNYTVLGEATSQLSDEIRAGTPRGGVAAACVAPEPLRPRLLVGGHGDPGLDCGEQSAVVREQRSLDSRERSRRVMSPVRGIDFEAGSATDSAAHRRRTRLVPIAAVVACTAVTFPQFMFDSASSIQPAGLPWSLASKSRVARVSRPFRTCSQNDL